MPATDPAILPAMRAFITNRLSKSVDMGRERFTALSETAERFNETRWFWTDDNAKAAELLAEPAFYDADPAPADAAIDFVMRMSGGAVIGRRCGPPEMRVLSTDPKAFRVETAFFILEGDLSLGVVRQSLRFNDGRTVIAAQHTGNLLDFRHGTRKRVVDVENTIDDFGVETGPDSFTVWHSSRIPGPRRFMQRTPPAPIARLRYTYTVGADLPSVGLKVELTPDPGIELHDVVLSTALDQLSSVQGIDYHRVAIRAGGTDTAHQRVENPPARLHTGPAEYVCVSQIGGSPGFSYGIHVLVQDDVKLAEVMARGQKNGLLHWLVLSYKVGTVPAGTTATVAETRMLTGGGYYDALEHYETVLRGGIGGGGYDPSMTYDIGAELNAVAANILLPAAVATPTRPRRTAWPPCKPGTTATSTAISPMPGPARPTTCPACSPAASPTWRCRWTACCAPPARPATARSWTSPYP